jgi:hypothetical protein
MLINKVDYRFKASPGLFQLRKKLKTSRKKQNK